VRRRDRPQLALNIGGVFRQHYKVGQWGTFLRLKLSQNCVNKVRVQFAARSARKFINNTGGPPYVNNWRVVSFGLNAGWFYKFIHFHRVRKPLQKAVAALSKRIQLDQVS